ncbi:beta-galactosidase [Cellulomonas shaoxiangyii]|uniref:beta-galactosidase n=1 Tax=Cellulomonas shaoxiangyii TaxID=2566013 RepID=A0A4P7SH35_9CELL|nr:beta-galactosidase [Cellulomonas shaoxiangyii]QCB93001.1 beta-galactosidase [Cellulomonas shaoxiangyii]TGY85582.1 beta-galactosidase [Cellulomonas shaoxiangyii]
MPTLPRPVLFGAAYYHEYQPSPRLEQDLDLMAEAGFSVIRVGESVWSTWEPEDGVLDLDWLQPVVDGAHARGIATVLGTPTYAVPPWLARKHPEIAGESATGRRIPWGARQEVDLTHPAFRFHAERVIRAVVGRYADHPGVVGFQVDNEPGLHLLHNRGVFQSFVDHLRHTYGDVATLNREWGLTYWSHRLSTWGDLWTPDGNSAPQYDLAWRRFQARLVSEFIAWQAQVVREYARDDQFVTTCLAYSRPAVDDPDLTASLDVTAGNPYYAMQDALALPWTPGSPQGWTTSGTWSVVHSADRMYSSKQAPFLVTETNAGAIGGPAANFPAYDGQWRQVAWAMVARGARMIEYWHWHTLHHGAETYWVGVLPHDQQPGRVYDQLAALGAELRAAGDAVAGLVPDAGVGLLWSNASKWALTFQPSLADGAEPDPRTYEHVVEAFARGAFDAGVGVRILHDVQVTGEVPPGGDGRVRGASDAAGGLDPAQVARELPVLLVPALYVATDALLDWLGAYAAAGGHLVLGPRTAYADHEARARLERKPARLADAAGVGYQELTNLSAPVPVRATGDTGRDGRGDRPADGLVLPPGACATGWVDGLQAGGRARVLVEYEHPHLARWPAVTTAGHGRGRVTTVGTVPDAVLARALLTWLAPADDDWRRAVRQPVTVLSGKSAAGRRVRFVHNWSWEPTALAAPVAVTDALSGAAVGAGEPVELGAWDVRVLVEV